MFITLTIDTCEKKKKPIVRVRKNQNYNPAKGWYKSIHMKKRSLWQRLFGWKNKMKKVSQNAHYKLKEQLMMF